MVRFRGKESDQFYGELQNHGRIQRKESLISSIVKCIAVRSAFLKYREIERSQFCYES